jgi:hypothetical protein
MNAKKALIAALSALALPALAHAAAKPAARDLPDWNGIWERVGSITWEPNGRPGVPENPPFTPEYAEKYRKTTEAAREGHPVQDPTSTCLPPGMPRVMTMTYPMEILMTPGQVTIIAEWSSQVRRVFTDGRGHPPADELDPTFNGHSIGHWEGKGKDATLVIDTVGIRADTGFDASGIEHSDQIHVVERMRQTSPDMLEDEITVIDPKAFVHPWVVTKKYKRGGPDARIMEYVCEENNRDPLAHDAAKP